VNTFISKSRRRLSYT